MEAVQQQRGEAAGEAAVEAAVEAPRPEAGWQREEAQGESAPVAAQEAAVEEVAASLREEATPHHWACGQSDQTRSWLSCSLRLQHPVNALTIKLAHMYLPLLISIGVDDRGARGPCSVPPLFADDEPCWVPALSIR